MESKFLNGEGVRHLNNRLQVRNALDRINIIDVNSTSTVSQPDVNCIYRISNAVPRIGDVDKICINLEASPDEFLQKVLSIPDNQWLSNKQLSEMLSLDENLNPKFYIVCQTESASGLGLVKLTVGEGALYGLVDIDLTTHWSAIKYADGSYESQWGSESFVRIEDQVIPYGLDLDLPTGAYNSFLSEFISVDMDFNTSATYAIFNGSEWEMLGGNVTNLQNEISKLQLKVTALENKLNILSLTYLGLETKMGQWVSIDESTAQSIRSARQIEVGEPGNTSILTLAGTTNSDQGIYFYGMTFLYSSPIPAYVRLSGENKIMFANL